MKTRTGDARSSASPADSRAWPVVTTGAWLVTAAAACLQAAFPAMLSQLDRRPAAYEQGEWWRWFTAILVYDEGWLQLVCNLSALALVGFWVERWYGRFRWLAFYGLGGLAGQAAGTFWQPYGAGASVAVCGLLGALCVWLVLRGQGLPRRVRIWGALGLFGAVWLCVIRDIHGPPVLVAAGLATVMLRRDRLPPASSSDRSGLRSGRASD